MSVPLRFIAGPVMKFDDSVRDANHRLLRPDLEAGDASWTVDNLGEPAVLNFVCPCGCKAVQTVTIKHRNNPRGWDWDGNHQKPTLRPSIWSKKENGGCGWHGWITSGVADGHVE